MEITCISTFELTSKIEGITLNKNYQVKFIHNDMFLIIDDNNKPKMVPMYNFIDAKKLEFLQSNKTKILNII